MRVAYIVFTCQAYLKTRVVWQKATVFASGMDDVYYIGPRADASERLYHWGAEDDYKSLPYKMGDFFRASGLDYDWYFIMDDDTYLYRDRLERRVQELEATGIQPREAPYMEGCLLTHLAHTGWGVYHSGGAGTLISAKVYDEVRRSFLAFRDVHHAPYWCPHWCADICLGQWTAPIVGLCRVHSDRYHTDPAKAGDGVAEAITFHHLRRREDYYAHQYLGMSVGDAESLLHL